MARLNCILGDVINLKRGYDLPNQVRLDGSVPIVSSSGITGYHVESKVKGPGVITGRYGTLGEIHYVERDYWPLNTTLYVQDFKGNNPRFIAYLLKTMDFGSRSAAAAVPGVNRNDLHMLPVSLPDVQEQLRIASILSAYDDLIENNIRRIAVLEEMTRRLYEEWFVHFRFPGHEQVRMVESELGLIPEGWSTERIGNLIEFKKGKKPESVAIEQSNGLLRHLLIDALRGGSRAEFVSPEKMVGTRTDDTIMVMDGSGSSEVFIGHRGVIGSTLGRYRVLPECGIHPLWLFLFFISNLSEIKSKNIGAAIPHANKDFIHGIVVPVAKTEIADHFGRVARPMFELISTLRKKNNNLRAQRDLLLPKLISGEIDVSAFPIEIVLEN